MKITRNTMRADGITVGEAMDRDAAFLMGIGIPTKDGQPTHDEKEDALDEIAEEFAGKVLEKMDELVTDGKGWKDEDLKHLLPVLRAHGRTLIDRDKNFVL